MSAPDDWTPDAFAPLGEAGDGLLIGLEDRAKDEWSHHLNDGFAESGRGLSAATKTNEDGFRYEERWFNDGTKDRARLMIFNGRTGLYVLLGTRDGGDSGAEAAYRGAVAYAIDHTGKRESVPWEATIAQMPESRGLRRTGLRVGAGEAHNLRIESWGSLHGQDVPGWYLESGIQVSNLPFWPIRVTGTVSCYSWREDGAEATAPRLRYLVELLTLAFDCPMDVRVGPYEASLKMGGEDDLVVPGLRAPTLPDDSPWRGYVGAVATDVPPWVTAALDGTMDRTDRRALSAHYEGMLLKSDHPSMALLAFVAAIETLATPRKRLPRCETCDAVLGSGERFREALATVLPPEDVLLVGNVYNRRSRTVHDGRLHGSEDVLGMFPVLRLYSADLTGTHFELGTVHLAAKASRELLLSRFSAPPTGGSDS